MTLTTKLATLATADSHRKGTLLADLSELLNRSSYHGDGDGFSFHDPEMAALPARLSESDRRTIALKAGSILADSQESGPVRAAAAFVLGKTHAIEALESVVQVICAEGTLPDDVVRQCAFAYDMLSETCKSARPPADTGIIGRHFVRYGIPWDSADRRVIADEL